jgi:hypothetical protein
VAFVCSVCGELHDERMLDVRMTLPDAIHALPEAERRERAWLAEDFAVLDERTFYVRGLLEIPVPELATRFAYGVWLEVDEPDFRFLLEHWDDPAQAGFHPVDARLANELAPYVATEGLIASLQPVSADLLPLAALHEIDHPLYRDQRAGISSGRADELAAVVLHA